MSKFVGPKTAVSHLADHYTGQPTDQQASPWTSPWASPRTSGLDGCLKTGGQENIIKTSTRQGNNYQTVFGWLYKIKQLCQK